ncbi:MAG: UDP-glucose/GDP-mannose dehydrogenase family protein [Candidatus Gastranaerophilales bacterium]|nr:UDP-glucose/GDP-mannose dehydrogenase family protein [Candidatus Gastranaerophilales bacterium]
MKICVIGAGYVGLTCVACLAEIGHQIVCIEKDEKKLNNLKKGIVSIFEPNMEELILKNKSKITFSSEIKDGLIDSNICYIAVGTPTLENGEVDTNAIFEVANEIAKNIKNYTIIINKSTVPIGFNKKITNFMKERTKTPFDIVSNPEFLRQGSAINDFLNPERLIIGTSSKKALEEVLKLYKPLNLNDNQILTMDENSAEMVKYAANSFLALKISYINEIAKLCEKTGANIEHIKLGLSKDSRIGEKFLNAGIGFGGSCFPKDTKAIVNIAKEKGIELETIKSAIEINENQIEYFFQKIMRFYKNNIKNKTFAILGLAFKPNTNDLREAPSLKLIKKLESNGAKIKAYDPKAKIENHQVESVKEAINEANALVITTEWQEFKELPLETLLKLKDKAIFDGRNIFINKNLNEYGLQYFCIGKNE